MAERWSASPRWGYRRGTGEQTCAICTWGRVARRNGIGRAMVEAAAAALRGGARRLWVETQAINDGAVCFYERMGFEWCGLDTSLYEPAEVEEGEVALYYSRALAWGQTFAVRRRTRRCSGGREAPFSSTSECLTRPR